MDRRKNIQRKTLGSAATIPGHAIYQFSLQLWQMLHMLRRGRHEGVSFRATCRLRRGRHEGVSFRAACRLRRGRHEGVSFRATCRLRRGRHERVSFRATCRLRRDGTRIAFCFCGLWEVLCVSLRAVAGAGMRSGASRDAFPSGAGE